MTHDHGPRRHDRAFAIGVGLNLIYVAAEATFGAIVGWMALLADAGHNLSDVRLCVCVEPNALRDAVSLPVESIGRGLTRVARLSRAISTVRRLHRAESGGKLLQTFESAAPDRDCIDGASFGLME